MLTKRFWGPVFDDRRSLRRLPADFYGVELNGGGRYLRRICNVSPDGILFENRLADERPGQLIELELPRGATGDTVRIRAEVVYVTPRGQVGARRVDGDSLDGVGGAIAL